MIGKRIFDSIFRHADIMPDHPAMIYHDEIITYGKFRFQGIAYAKKLLNLGLHKGDRLAYISANCPQFSYLYIGASLVGIECVGINVRATMSEIKKIIFSSGAKVVFVSKQLHLAPDKLESIPVICLDDPDDHSFMHSLFDCSISDETIYKKMEEITEDDIVFVIHTSGTTGFAKGALLSHRGILASVKYQLQEFCAPTGCTPETTIMNYYPTNHVSGALQFGLAPFISGSTIIGLDRFDPFLVLETTQKYHVPVLSGVPTMWKMILGMESFNKFDLSSVKWCAIGATQANEGLIRQILERFGILSNPLGMTELSGFCSGFSGVSNYDLVANTVGHIIPRLETIIVDDNDNILKTGDLGEICYKGDSVIPGYYNTTLKKTASGYMKSGDVGFFDKNRYFHYCGRKDDMFFVGGYNVHPTEIEHAILSIDGIEDVVVCPKKHKTMGNVCRAYIVLRDTKDLSKNRIINILENSLIYYKIPRDIIFVDHIERNIFGKINRHYYMQQDF